MELTERKKQILRIIVEDYIAAAEPVGSKAISAKLNLSSATIRNEMADLEELGYLEKPHTSAGRVPSPKGYRLYVNELMEQQRLSLEETRQINQALHSKMQELDRVIDQAGKMVSQLTNYPAFALTGGTERAVISRFDLILVDSNSFIAVIMTDSRQVRNKLFRLPNDLTEDQLQMLTTLLNTAFHRQDAGGADARADAGGGTCGRIFLWADLHCGVLCHGMSGEYGRTGRYSPPGPAICWGIRSTRMWARHKGYSTICLIHPSSASLPMPVMSGEDNTRILIGPENVAEELKDTSVVLASYDIGDGMKGVIGVVGPTRMDYAKVAAKLSCVAEGLSHLFGQELPPPEKEKTDGSGGNT